MKDKRLVPAGLPGRSSMLKKLLPLLVVLLVAALAPAGYAQRPEGGSDNRFGLVLIPAEPAWLDRAYQAGARVDRYQVNWWDVEPSPGHRTWEYPDREIEAARAAGFEVTVILTAPPEWARRPGSKWVPAGLDRPWDDPTNAWGAFVHAAVSHYKGRVRYYEIFNEPDLEHFWDGSPEEYAALLATAYRAVKAADPEAQVIMAGMAHWSRPDFAERVLHTLHEMPDAAAHNYFFDIAAWHWYSRADQLYERVLWARELLGRYGMSGKPIWINETNIPVWGDGAGPQEPVWGFGSPAEQAAFMVQAFTNAFAAGAERVFVFRLNDGGMDQTFGLMRDDGTPRPAYKAYATAARWLAGTRFVTREVRGDVVLTTFRRPPDEKITVAWATGQAPTSVLLDAAGDNATLVNVVGDSTTIEPVGGLYHLGLGGGSTYTRAADGVNEQLVAGPPVILVEEDRTPPLLRLQPLPEMSASETITLTWEVETPSGEPVESIEVQVRVDGGPWEPWDDFSAAESGATYPGQSGHRYEFRARALDQLGRKIEWPPDEQPMAATVVAAVVTGLVLDARDLPLRHMPVCAGGQCTRSDTAGYYRLSPLPAGPLTITVPGYAHATAVVTAGLGMETSAPVLRVIPPENLLADGDMEQVAGAWVMEPEDGATVATVEGGRQVARIDAGARIAQPVVIRTHGDPVLSLRYRVESGGPALQLGIYQRTAGLPYTRLLLDVDTQGEWRELWFDMSAFAGQELIVEIAAPGAAGTIEVDEIRLGPSALHKPIYVPLLQASSQDR